MGGILSYFRGLLGQREMRILILGLDGAGKTTILYRLQVGEVVTTIPTIGFNVEQVTYKNLKFQVWDLGGQTSIRPYWRCYYSNTDAIIYVVDSADKDRIGISKQVGNMSYSKNLRGFVGIGVNVGRRRAQKCDFNGASEQTRYSGLSFDY